MREKTGVELSLDLFELGQHHRITEQQHWARLTHYPRTGPVCPLRMYISEFMYQRIQPSPCV